MLKDVFPNLGDKAWLSSLWGFKGKSCGLWASHDFTLP